MRLITALFPDSAGRYRRLADALAASVAANSPRTPLTVLELPALPAEVDPRPTSSLAPARVLAYRRNYPPPPRRMRRLARRHDPKRAGLVSNTAKMVAWDDAIQASRDGELVGLLDCDTLVLGDLTAVEALDFDATYTVRPPWSRYPFNSGVVFARVSPRVKEFFRRWRERNVAMLADSMVHQPWRAKFAGVNQAALGSIIAEGAGINLVPVDCWWANCEDTSWRQFDEERTLIVHVKSELRRICLNGGATGSPNVMRLAAIWREYDRAGEGAAHG